MLRNVEAGPDLADIDYPDHLGPGQLEMGRVPQIPVHPETNPGPVPIDLQMHITGPGGYRVEDDGVEQRHGFGVHRLHGGRCRLPGTARIGRGPPELMQVHRGPKPVIIGRGHQAQIEGLGVAGRRQLEDVGERVAGGDHQRGAFAPDRHDPVELLEPEGHLLGQGAVDLREQLIPLGKTQLVLPGQDPEDLPLLDAELLMQHPGQQLPVLPAQLGGPLDVGRTGHPGLHQEISQPPAGIRCHRPPPLELVPPVWPEEPEGSMNPG